MAKKNYEELASQIIVLVGGKDNVTYVTHCMTRLRFNLKDKGLVKDKGINDLSEVLGSQFSGDQFQIIIGPMVEDVYTDLCKVGKFTIQNEINENLDKEKEKITLKKIGSNILDYLSGSMTQLIPVMMAAAMFKSLQVVLGPELLNIISMESDMYLLCDFVYNAFFYFLPVFLGYAAAKKLGTNPTMGMLIGTLLIVPDLIALADSGANFTIYGLIPCQLQNYAQTVLPVILSVWVMFYVEKYLKKYIPSLLSSILVPFMTMLIMVPIALCILGPAGSIAGDYIAEFLAWFQNVGGFIASGIIGLLWQLLVMTGMHHILVTLSMTTIMSAGCEAFIFPASGAAMWATFGIAFGAFLRIRNKKEKTIAFGHFVSGIIGGLTEPAMFGVAVRFKKPFIAMMIGGLCGGLYMGITNVAYYTLASTNFLDLTAYLAGGTANFINACIGNGLGFVVGAVLTYLFGFEKDDAVMKK